jgi:hypothetical protein
LACFKNDGTVILTVNEAKKCPAVVWWIRGSMGYGDDFLAEGEA